MDTGLKNQNLRTKPSNTKKVGLIIWGRLHGKETYISFGSKESKYKHRYLGTLSGYKLYRVAKAIVRRWENN